jgi:probable HAF family extracellular repeat protein
VKRLSTNPPWVLAMILALATGLSAGQRDAAAVLPDAPPVYAADFVSTAASGAAMNEAGDVTGTAYRDTGCGPFCLPPQDTVVWRGGAPIVLPALPGLQGISVRSINNQGWVAGFAGFPNTTTHAVVWKPVGNGYQAIDLGVLPGTATSEAIGIDDLGRVVGWSRTLNFPPQGSPFLWTEAGGMVDLTSLGFPDEAPLAISPGGTVGTASYWYPLDHAGTVDDAGGVQSLPPPPQGFMIGTFPTAINDAGDQVRFLVSTGPQNLVYLFRFHHEGTWQQVSSAGTGHLSTYGVGSIDAARDLTATVQSTAVVAPGPDGTAQALAPLLSPAYGGATIGRGGPMNASGQILTMVMVGRSHRLMKLVPAAPCGANCIKVGQLAMRGEFVQDPDDPGSCAPGGNAFNRVEADLLVTDEAGAPLGGVVVTGRFLDDYWTDRPVSGTTDAQGRVSFVNVGSCAVGAVAFLVDRATQGSRVFDRTTGVVANSVIPE